MGLQLVFEGYASAPVKKKRCVHVCEDVCMWRAQSPLLALELKRQWPLSFTNFNSQLGGQEHFSDVFSNTVVAGLDLIMKS